ncbi:MAG: glycosyl transferase family 36 [Candidatus Marinimicrobia bacterium]|nr:glycosyl transferase family 36 [Candidatus Neomarinimicrobiota bacterium]
MDKIFATKYGGFSKDGNEYIITNPRTPKPWVNVLSNGDYGLVVSQTAGGFSWLTHSELNRITRWQQDLTRDNHGKYLYILDRATGIFWNPGWLPARTELDNYQCRHGFGYTSFISAYDGIQVELTLSLANAAPVEFWDVKVANLSGRPRQLSLITYFEWGLGCSNDHHREFHKIFTALEFDRDANAILASKRLWDIHHRANGRWNRDYPYVGFHTCSKEIAGFEGDKLAFLGQYGSLREPRALLNGELTGSQGMGREHIGSLQVNCDLAEGAGEQLMFSLGLAENHSAAKELARKYQSVELAQQELKRTKSAWATRLNATTVETPDQALNLLVNKWLKYQAIAGRLLARSAYYQQSGAFGFRDQLQDSQIYLTSDPRLTRERIKEHARHQFSDGTVLHWWHPILNEGLHSEMSDNLLWLPFVTISYLQETADYPFLEEIVAYYDEPDRPGSIFGHCCAAIDRVLARFSGRGLPLICEGDWNDGLSAIGIAGQGESVWLAHFLIYLLERFSKIAEKHGDVRHSVEYATRRENLIAAVNRHGWDGAWFIRGTKDSGEEFGSSANTYGKIFLNPQTWSVISDGAAEKRQVTAMASVAKHLLKKNGPLLLYPAYAKVDVEIGYLSRYAPGARENGGVYTHAAIWAIWAYAKLRQADAAYDVFRRLCPINNGLEPDTYLAEPYVTPGNIDGPDSAFYGRGGWTWYSGSAAWLQKVVVDRILGVRATENGLLIDPCLPAEWKTCRVRRLFRGVTYDIIYSNPQHSTAGPVKIIVAGKEITGNLIEPVAADRVKVEVLF